MSDFRDRDLHLMGIGGAGMSALAVVAYAWGAQVSGCDRAASSYSERVGRFGIPVAGATTRRTCVRAWRWSCRRRSADDAASSAPAAMGLRILPRAALLAEMVALRRSICVAGRHGKTTTRP